MPQSIENPVMHRFSGGDLTEFGGDVRILEELEQQFVRSIRSAEERNAGGEARLSVPLVEELGHLSSDRG